MTLHKRLTASGFSFKKSLGQNFIIDEGYLQSVVKDLNISKDDVVVEVGTGAGTLTRVLAQYAKKVITYEVDARLEPILSEQFSGFDNIKLRFQDALKTDIDVSNFRVIANIPYYITTPLITKFLNDPNCTSIIVLVQKEVAERIVAKPGSKVYGALSAGIQIRSSAKIIKTVSRKVFFPEPNVDSAFVQIDDIRPIEAGFDEFLKKVFGQRRKKISNIIRNLYNIQIDDERRPEQLTPKNLFDIFRQIQ